MHLTRNYWYDSAKALADEIIDRQKLKMINISQQACVTHVMYVKYAANFLITN